MRASPLRDLLQQLTGATAVPDPSTRLVDAGIDSLIFVWVIAEMEDHFGYLARFDLVTPDMTIGDFERCFDPPPEPGTVRPPSGDRG